MLEQREGKPHILIVDDEPEIRNLLCELLREEYDCATACSAEEALSRLADAEFDKRDTETSGHSERVVAFSLRLGRELGLGAEQSVALEFGSLLHDIGKIGVPDAILRKPAALDEAEWFEMRKHPRHGQHILSGIKFLEGASRVVAQHHERFDGTGYPLGLCGEQIDFNARIFAVADAFDAITSDRVYRKAKPYGAAIAELEEWAGRQFDAEVVEAFRRVPREEWDDLRSHSFTKNAEEDPTSTVVSVAAAQEGRATRGFDAAPSVPLTQNR